MSKEGVIKAIDNDEFHHRGALPNNFRTVDSVAYKKAMLLSPHEKMHKEHYEAPSTTLSTTTENPAIDAFFFAVSLKINNFMNSFVGNALRAASYFYF